MTQIFEVYTSKTSKDGKWVRNTVNRPVWRQFSIDIVDFCIIFWQALSARIFLYVATSYWPLCRLYITLTIFKNDKSPTKVHVFQTKIGLRSSKHIVSTWLFSWFSSHQRPTAASVCPVMNFWPSKRPWTNTKFWKTCTLVILKYSQCNI